MVSHVSPVVANIYMEMLEDQALSLVQSRSRMWKRQLTFLDTVIKRETERTIDFSVYRKPTNMDHYLQYSSHHP